MDLIDIKDLSISYKNKSVIKKLNLKIKENETLCVIGKSGIGKTTLLKAILDIIEYDGIINRKIQNIAYMPQELALFNKKSVYFNVILPLKIKNKEIDVIYIDSILKDLDILNIKNQKICNISGGQKSRVALARSIVQKNKLLLLDEPLSKLDYFTKQNIIKLLKDIKTKYKVSYVYVTHDLKEVKNIANKVLIIRDNDYVITDKVEEEELLNYFK